MEQLDSFSVVKAFVGVVLLIGWMIFLRATLKSLGLIGTILAVAFFGLLLWLLVDQGWVSMFDGSAFIWLVLVALAAVLSTGMSWSHIRRRMTGQVDVDDTDD